MGYKKNQNNLMKRLSTVIVDKRSIIFFIYIAALIFCLFSMSWVEVENDITKYLPEDTETRQGIVAMNENFASFATARVMVSHVTVDQAHKLATDISKIDGIAMATFDETEEHYKNANALIDVTYVNGPNDPITIAATHNIRTLLAGFDHYINSDVGVDMNAMLQEEMGVILLVAVVIIIVVLVLTSRSYAEVPVLLITFGVAALLNMGTNFIFGKISFISNSVAVVLQLALAIDYAIILCHRFTDEHESKNARDAAIIATSKAIPEIFASSLTTVSGLLALAFMKFSLGFDMSIVLIKSIILSLLSVFTLMPGLLVLFCPIMDKTRHKKLLPSMKFLGKFAVKSRKILPPIFLIIILAGFYFSSQCPYCYSFNDLKTAKMTESQQAYFKIKDTFGTSNMVALIVPSGNYESESAILSELSDCPEVKSTMGLSGIEALDGYKLTDALTPRQLSELLDMDYEVIQVLYAAYASEHNQYGQILNGLDEYSVPLFDMFLYLNDMMKTNNISLSVEGMEDMGDMLSQLETAQKQLTNDKYSRMVVYLNLPEEGEETYAFLQTIRDITGKYYPNDYYVVGNSTNSRDLSASFVTDNLMISLLSAFFVIIVLIFTFKSVGLPILLILVIQGSIWINFSVPTFTGQPLYFLGYLIVQAIQMGANIDYAIVISSHYQELKQEMSHKEAIVEAVNSAFPTVFTSGTMMASAGLLIGNMSTQPVISIMGNCIGRGTIISVILVLFVLPSILVLGDSVINKTSFKFKAMEMPALRKSGSVKLNGRVHGYISGHVDGQFQGTVRGDMDIALTSDTKFEEEGAENES